LIDVFLKAPASVNVLVVPVVITSILKGLDEPLRALASSCE